MAEAESEVERPKVEREAPTGEQKICFTGVTKAVGERQIRTVISSESEDRDGDIVVVGGIDLKFYLQNPVVLFQHNSSLPIARGSDVHIQGKKLISTVDFPPSGVSAKSDEVLGLLKAEILNATSIGFAPKKDGWQWRDKENPWNGIKFNETELMEFSIVSIPSNRDALVISRSAGLKENDFCVWASGGRGQIKRVTEEDIFEVVEWAKSPTGEWGPTDSVQIFTRNKLQPFKPIPEPIVKAQEDENPACGEAADDGNARARRLRVVEVAKRRGAALLP